MTPTVFYWLNILNSKVINPRKLDKKYLNKFETIILVRYVPLNILLDLILLKRKSKSVIIDVGAHNGETIKKIKTISPKSIVHSFNPRMNIMKRH